MVEFAEAVLALFAALIFSASTVLLILALLDSFNPSFFSLQMLRELVQTVERYQSTSLWGQVPEEQQMRAFALRSRLDSLEKHAMSPGDDFRGSDRFSAALVWGEDQKATYKKMRKTRRRVVEDAMVATREELVGLEESGLQILLRDGQAVIWKNAWGLRLAALKIYGRLTVRTVVARHGRHSLFAGVVGMVMFFFVFSILRLAGSTIRWSSAWSFFTDFFVLLVIAAVPVLALAAPIQADNRRRPRARWGFIGAVIPVGLIALVAIDVSSESHLITRWYEYVGERTTKLLDALPFNVVGVALGLAMITFAIRIVTKIPAHRRKFPARLDDRFSMLGQASLLISCGGLFGSLSLVASGDATLKFVQLTLIPGLALGGLFQIMSTAIEWKTRLSQWRGNRRNGERRPYPHPLLVLFLGISAYSISAILVSVVDLRSPSYKLIETAYVLWQTVAFVFCTPILMFAMWRLRARQAKADLVVLETRLIEQTSGIKLSAPPETSGDKRKRRGSS